MLIETQELSKYYPVPRRGMFEKQKYVRAVEKLNLMIPEGCTYGLVGESGCGKSTTGHMLAGIDSATSGKVLYNGKDILSMHRAERRDLRLKIQMIFQDPYASLNPKHKIGTILEEPLRINTQLSKKERQKRVFEMLATVGLDDSYAAKYANELSGGQRQRISIAAALILNPEFVIADEAVSALDVSVQAQILNLLQKLQKEKNLTYLFISHDLNVVRYMSDYIGVMYLGHLVECGPAEEVCLHPLHPYTKALLSAVPDVSGQNQRIILEGEVPSPVDVPTGCPFHTRCSCALETCSVQAPHMRMHPNHHAVSCFFTD